MIRIVFADRFDLELAIREAVEATALPSKSRALPDVLEDVETDPLIKAIADKLEEHTEEEETEDEMETGEIKEDIVRD